MVSYKLLIMNWREILIFVFRFNEDDPLIIYSKVE